MDHYATYSPEDNKLRLYPGYRLPKDEYDRVKAAGFSWAAKQGLFVAGMWTPSREDLLEELCGEIGDEDTSLAERAAVRAERFDDYHDKRGREAEQARAAVSAIADNIPFGQPILVGHHSEKRARRDAERIRDGMTRAVKLWKTSQYWTDRAAGALAHAKYKNAPGVRARRIKTLQADQRRRQRSHAHATKCRAIWQQTIDKEAGDCWKLTIEMARTIANRLNSYTAYDLLRPDDCDVAAIRARLILGCDNTIAHETRWIEHYEHRIAYETALLEEAGEAHRLAKQKPRKSAKSELPILNYRAPGGSIRCTNLYGSRGYNEFIDYPQIDMTAAEWKGLYTDSKGTRADEHGTHRVRTTMRRSSLVSVFLTDSKVHPIPAPAPAPEPEPENTGTCGECGEEVNFDDHDRDRCAVDLGLKTTEREQICDESGPDLTPAPEDVSTSNHIAKPEVEPETIKAPDPFEQMAASLRAGVKVVSAHQLFPTPRALADRMAALADVGRGQFVLEPSAGTGALVQAIRARQPEATIVCVEINHNLAEQLRAQGFVTECADFLEWRPGRKFSRIVMNPPFERAIDVEHIEHARGMLAPGGLLVALCADGPRQRTALEPIADSYERLGQCFKPATGVSVALVVLSAPDAVRDVAEEISEAETTAPPIADVPFALMPTIGRARGMQGGLF